MIFLSLSEQKQNQSESMLLLLSYLQWGVLVLLIIWVFLNIIDYKFLVLLAAMLRHHSSVLVHCVFGIEMVMKH